MNAPNVPAVERLHERIRQVQEATRGISEQFPRAYILDCIRHDRFPTQMWTALGEYPLLGLSIPEQFGGSGGGVVEIVALGEALALGRVPTVFLVVTGLARLPIVRHGTPEPIAKFVTPTCDGSLKLCFAITEPNAGTNSFNISSFASRDGDQWVLNGQKVFISGARDADIMLVIARTQKPSEVAHRTEGMSLFVADMKSPGITLQPLNIQVETAKRQYMVFLDNVRLPADALIGEAGKGAKLMLEGLNSERLLAAAAALGIGEYALKKAVLASRAAVAAVEAAIQTHGGYAFDRDYDVITLWPMVRLMEIAPVNPSSTRQFWRGPLCPAFEDLHDLRRIARPVPVAATRFAVDGFRGAAGVVAAGTRTDAALPRALVAGRPPGRSRAAEAGEVAVVGTVKNGDGQGRRAFYGGEILLVPAHPAGDDTREATLVLRQGRECHADGSAIGMAGGINVGRIDAPAGGDLCRHRRELVHHRQAELKTSDIAHDEPRRRGELREPGIPLRKTGTETGGSVNHQQRVRVAGVVVARRDDHVRHARRGAALEASALAWARTLRTCRDHTGAFRVARVSGFDGRAAVQQAHGERDRRDGQHQCKQPEDSLCTQHRHEPGFHFLAVSRQGSGSRDSQLVAGSQSR